MSEDLLTKNPMDEDLLTKIQRETHERLQVLQGAVDEHDRLQADLRALQDIPESPVDLGPAVAPKLAAAPELPVASKPNVAAKPSAAVDIAPELPIAHEQPTNVVRLPARRPLSRTRMVSPKVARLMRTPRRPALERSGVVRVGAGRVGASAADDLWPQETGEDVDADAEVYERSL
jgi:hypothetical protein